MRPVSNDLADTPANRAVAAARSVASTLGLPVEDTVVLQESNRITLRLLPCDVLARVSRAGLQAARFEIEIAQRLATAGSPVAAPDPRVQPRAYRWDGHEVTLWTYHEPSTGEITPAAYAGALRRLHAGMRNLDVPAPHFTDRVEQAQRLLADHDRTPGLTADDRELLDSTLRRLRLTIGERAHAEQLLHGEPHPGNLLPTPAGPLFIDLETCCRGPVEFDLAHAPDDAGDHYPGADPALLHDCRLLTLAMATTWRWDRDDRLPNGRHLAGEWLSRLRSS
ncbi:phosphotransferase enzyme family protein [Actinoplanes flavus]|uniref:Aminoglycoside phosphotransferase family protein n=1 Tax=Actinoplanes flavus TaxID=2820290 RepID=A0ABS3UVV7_9ACTN|nr:aminoglycoside phosphotransferase family protein [Actinoplanes flavus]MBO3742677.1 aminoglycoside phosphotransferase family protein [Actinoplanes flavus]